MNAQDRLTARSLLIDELYLRASKAEHERDKEKKRADAAEAKLKDSERENAAARGEPVEPAHAVT